MFSITAINDVETSQSHVEHLAPTKEAQESWLTQMYGEALSHLQQGQFVEAQMLFQAILEDPISLKAQIENATGTGPMLQLRFALLLCPLCKYKY
jgi:calcineurin-binding protein cabin-1